MRTKIFFIALIAAAFMFALNSCQKNNPVSSTTDNTDLLAESIVPDVTVIQCDITDASNSDQMVMSLPNINVSYIRLGRILAQLKLDSLQKTQVKVFLVDYQDCYTTAMTTLRASEKVIIDSANAKRKVILNEFKNKTISADSALKAIRALNKATRDSLNNNPVLATTKTAVKACLDTLFANIKSVLNSTQITIWEVWIVNINTHPGNGKDDDDYHEHHGLGYYMGHHYGWRNHHHG